MILSENWEKAHEWKSILWNENYCNYLEWNGIIRKLKYVDITWERNVPTPDRSEWSSKDSRMRFINMWPISWSTTRRRELAGYAGEIPNILHGFAMIFWDVPALISIQIYSNHVKFRDFEAMDESESVMQSISIYVRLCQ